MTLYPSEQAMARMVKERAKSLPVPVLIDEMDVARAEEQDVPDAMYPLLDVTCDRFAEAEHDAAEDYQEWWQG